MFDELSTKAAGVVQLIRFAVQQVFVPLGMVFVGHYCLAANGSVANERPSGGLLVLNASPGLLGFFLGLLVRAVWQKATPTGRWIWILPFLVWLRALSYDWSLASVFGRAGSGESLTLGWATIPALGCICYSAAMFLPARPKRIAEDSPTAPEM